MNQIEKDPNVRTVLLVGDTTLDPLGRMLERDAQEPRFKVSVAPYGQIYQMLLDGSHPAWSARPDILVVWTAPDLTLPSLGSLLRFELDPSRESQDSILAEVDQFAAAILAAAPRAGMVLVPTWILPAHERWIQTLSWRKGTGLSYVLAQANLRLAEKLSAQPNITLLDSGFWQASLNRPAYDFRMFAFAKILYSQPLFDKAAGEIKAVVRGALGKTKKVIVCDLDNTLWAGVVGDDGSDNLKVGAPDPVGECFQSFQAALKRLSARGILLAICSKNDEELALSVIDEHPGMVLRRSDFAAWRINWKDKAQNFASLAEELNLGLDSFVFLDDSAEERDQVRQILPEVLTPEFPPSPSEYAAMVLSLNCFETPNLAREDFERTEMYRADRGRKDLLDMSGDLEKWLRSLQIEIKAEPLRRENLARAAQLLNKTNQFNLSLRRMDEKSFWEWGEQQGNSIYIFKVSDRFGDFGLTALASLSISGDDARIVDFVMSCRVMGKRVEEAILGYTCSRAWECGARAVSAPLTEGPRNQPVRGFFASKLIGGDSFRIDPERVSMPAEITLKEETGAAVLCS